MSPELNALLETMLVVAVETAGDVPAYRDPLDERMELQVDAYVLALAKTGQAGEMTKELAMGLIPRLQYARAYAGVAESMLDRHAKLEGGSVDEQEFLQLIFLKMWREQGRQLWAAGKLGGR